MLNKQTCPHTGIVNYFANTEPFFAIGSITQRQNSDAKFYWRVYNASKAISGMADDMKSAEKRLMCEYRAQARPQQC
jgi:hypothetical protein